MKSQIVFTAIINLACCFSLNARDLRAIRDSPNLDENGIYDLVDQIVDETTTGINATDLYKVAKILKQNADRLAPEESQEVILSTLLAAAAEIGLESEIQAVWDNEKTNSDGLTDVVKKIDAILKTLQQLATQGRNSEVGSNSAVLAAISKGAANLNDFLPTLVGHAIEYVNEQNTRDLHQDTLRHVCKDLDVTRSETEGSHLSKRFYIRVSIGKVSITVAW